MLLNRPGGASPHPPPPPPDVITLPRVDAVEVRHQQTSQEGESLRSRCSSCHGSRHLLPATTATSLWSVLEAEDERGQIDEPSHAERPRAPFLRPPLPPPELRPLSRLLRSKWPPRRRPEPHQHPMRLPRLHRRCHPRGGGGSRHPHHFCRHPRSHHPHDPTGAVPTVATVAASLFPPVAFRQLFLRGLARRRGRGPRRGPLVGP